MKFKHAGNVAWRRVEQEVIILNLETSVYFSVNSVGAFIWEKLGSGLTPEEIAASVCAEFDVKPADARKHIDTFIEQLKKQDLVQPQ